MATTAQPVASQLTDVAHLVKLIALAGCVKPKALGEAKAALAEPSAHQVAFDVRVRGQVSKGIGTPPGTGSAHQTVDLFTRGIVFSALRKLKVSANKLRAALQAAGEEGWGLAPVAKVDDCADLAAVFDEVSSAMSDRLPAREIQTPGRAAAVRTDATFELLT